MKHHFDCDDVGELSEYVGCKILQTDSTIRFAQPVLLQSFEDEFKCKAGKTQIPPKASGNPEECKPSDTLSKVEQTNYCSGVGKLLHIMHWSRPEIYNAVRELSGFMMIGASKYHMLAMEKVMNYCLATRERGLLLEPTQVWDGNLDWIQTMLRM